ncbi:MAG: hypothetical protein KF754_00490 [Planctomycetes bacterium]|nr:hypothetical protein [Planctomycetota bacterium]
MANELKKLAHLAGRDDLTDSQLKQLAEPAAFVFSRMAALAIGEVRELKLFLGPTGRTEKDYARLAGRRRGSVASQFSVWLRKVFLPGRALPSTVPRSALSGTWCTSFDARIGSRSGRAIFVWRDDVYRPRSDEVCDPKLTRLLAHVDRLLRQTPRCIGEVTSWGLISRAVPTRHAGLKGYLYPIGRGLNLQSRPVTDRPSVSAELGAMLTGFFHDEPMTQAYSKNAWLIVGPGRLFVVVPDGRQPDLANWLHSTDEPARLAELEKAYLHRQTQKQQYYQDYEEQRAKAQSRSKRGRPKTDSARRQRSKAETKPLSIQALQDQLERILAWRRHQ